MSGLDAPRVLPFGWETAPEGILLRPANLRLADLVAKTAHVTLKDTMRVILALDAVAGHLRGDALSVMAGMEYTPTRPAPENVAACERASYELNGLGYAQLTADDLRRSLGIETRLSLIRELR